MRKKPIYTFRVADSKSDRNIPLLFDIVKKIQAGFDRPNHDGILVLFKFRGISLEHVVKIMCIHRHDSDV